MLRMQSVEKSCEVLRVGGIEFQVSRPHPGFGLVIDGLAQHGQPAAPALPADDMATEGTPLHSDYLHQHLLNPEHRSEFFDLIAMEGLVICRNIDSNHPSYRKVRGKSSYLKLSQAEYYHHDGCNCPQNPRLVEIRLPYQELDRNVATAVAPFPAVMRAMLQALPAGLQRGGELGDFRARLEDSSYWNFDRRQFLDDLTQPYGTPRDGAFVSQWDRAQGQLIRLVRRELDAASCRAYYREVDVLAGAYVWPWTMGESRLMLNFDSLPEITMQHRRAYQKQRNTNESNGHLVKRWTAEEL